MAKKEYIEREAVLFGKFECTFVEVDGETYLRMKDVGRYLKEIPVADVVEVVRCKNCKYWEDGWMGYCTKRHTAMHYDGFCSYGKRRAKNES